MLTTQGSLVMIGLNTDNPQILFNGFPVPGIVQVKVSWEADERKVQLRVNGNNEDLYRRISDAGISIKKVAK